MKEFLYFQALLKLDFGTLFIYTSILLDFWARSFKYLSNHNYSSDSFVKLVNQMHEGPRNSQAESLWKDGSKDMLYLSTCMTLIRTSFYVHDNGLSKGYKFGPSGYELSKYGDGVLSELDYLTLGKILAKHNGAPHRGFIVQSAISCIGEMNPSDKSKVIKIAKAQGGYSIGLAAFVESLIRFLDTCWRSHKQILSNHHEEIQFGF